MTAYEKSRVLLQIIQCFISIALPLVILYISGAFEKTPKYKYKYKYIDKEHKDDI